MGCEFGCFGFGFILLCFGGLLIECVVAIDLGFVGLLVCVCFFYILIGGFLLADGFTVCVYLVVDLC